MQEQNFEKLIKNEYEFDDRLHLENYMFIELKNTYENYIRNDFEIRVKANEYSDFIKEYDIHIESYETKTFVDPSKVNFFKMMDTNIDIPKDDSLVPVCIRLSNPFLSILYSRNNNIKRYNRYRKEIFENLKLRGVISYIEKYRKELMNTKEFKLFKNIIFNQFPSLQFMKKYSIIRLYNDLINYCIINDDFIFYVKFFDVKVNLVEDIKMNSINKKIEIFRKCFLKSLKSELEKIVFIYDLYIKTVVDERELNDIMNNFKC